MPAMSAAMRAHGGFAVGAQFPAETRTPPDEREARVRALRSAQTSSGLAAGNLSATTVDPTQVATRKLRLHRAPVLTAAQRVLLPLAVVSSAAAAGVHAAVGPEHFRGA